MAVPGGLVRPQSLLLAPPYWPQFEPALTNAGICLTVPPKIGPCTPLAGVAMRVSMILQGSSGLYTSAGDGWTAAVAAPASMIPAPHEVAPLLLQSAPPVLVGKTRAVVCITASTCAGVKLGLMDSNSDAIPATCGVAILVPI